MAQEISPDQVLAKNDPGDDTLRRYRYQAAYAALVSVDLLDDSSDFDEIFCEHHEDTLIKKKDATFIGIQVKTRKSGRALFKANDEHVLNSIKRFVEQDIEFPNKYSRFVFATNYAFWTEKESSSNLLHVLELAQEVEITKPLSAFIKKVKKKLADIPNATEQRIINVLKKTKTQELPKFDDLPQRIVDNLKSNYGDATITVLQDAANNLTRKMLDASSLKHTSAKQLYFSLLNNPEQKAVDTIIQGKRISRADVKQIIEDSISAKRMLQSREGINVSTLSKGYRKLEIKATKGGISADNIDLLKDHKYATESLLANWLYKNSSKTTNERFDQISLIVKNECQEEFDLVQDEAKPFGLKMLIGVRNRLKQRLNQNPEAFFGVQYEHLLGTVGILTEECKVWWSEKFDIDKGVS